MNDPGDASTRGLDTNVLARYLLADDPDQHAEASELIETELTPEAPGLVHPVVLCELVWVLRQVYKVPKADVVHALRQILALPTVRVLDRAAVREAVDLYDTHAADFADCYLLVKYRAAEADLTTFDRAASRLPGARRLPTASP